MARLALEQKGTTVAVTTMVHSIQIKKVCLSEKKEDLDDGNPHRRPTQPLNTKFIGSEPTVKGYLCDFSGFDCI